MGLGFIGVSDPVYHSYGYLETRKEHRNRIASTQILQNILKVM